MSNLLRTRITRKGFIFLAAILPILPHLAIVVSPDLSAALALVCYVPIFLQFMVPTGPLAPRLGLLGALHGASLALIAAAWVWTFKNLPFTVPLIAAALAAGYYAGVFALLGCLIKHLQRTGCTLPLVKAALIAVVLTGAETLRGLSPDLFLPLGSLAFAAGAPPLLPVAAVGGIPALGLFAFALNASLATALAQSPHTRLWPAVSALGALAVIVLASYGYLMLRVSGAVALPTGIPGILCAYSDFERRNRPFGGYLGAAELAVLVQEAKMMHDCDVVVFPESTSPVARNAHPAVDATSPQVVLGTQMVDEVRDGLPFVRATSTNSVCLASVTADEIGCVARVDKQFLAPFVEAELFHGWPALHPFGAWLTRLVTGYGNSETSTLPGTVLDIPGSGRLGVFICLELFLPWQSQHDREGKTQPVSLIIAPVDHSSFPPLVWMRALKRQAASLQAVAAHVPLLLVSTEDVALFSARGTLITPTHILGELHVWEPVHLPLIEGM